jgi:hypothetical protein
MPCGRPSRLVLDLTGFKLTFINGIESGVDRMSRRALAASAPPPARRQSGMGDRKTKNPRPGGEAPVEPKMRFRMGRRTSRGRWDSGPCRDSFRDSSSGVRTHFRPSMGLIRGSQTSKKPRKHFVPEASCGRVVGDIGLEPMTPSLSS